MSSALDNLNHLVSQVEDLRSERWMIQKRIEDLEYFRRTAVNRARYDPTGCRLSAATDAGNSVDARITTKEALEICDSALARLKRELSENERKSEALSKSLKM